MTGAGAWALTTLENLDIISFPMKKYHFENLFYTATLVVLLLAVLKIVFHLNFLAIPLFFFAIGLASVLLREEHQLYLFLLLFPFINASSGLFDNSYAFNYIAPSLFLLGGIVVSRLLKAFFYKQKGEETGFATLADQQTLNQFHFYFIFLLFLVVSFIFVWLRWTNITTAGTGVFSANLPVSPGTRAQRISFGSIFPVVSLFIYFVTPYIFFLIRRIKASEKTVFSFVSYGFMISTSFGLYQKILNRSLISDRLGKEQKQFYGGFSDFNAFGFFSGVMFLWATFRIKERDLLGYIILVVSLAGCILSGSRTAFFFIAAGILNLLLGIKQFDKRKKRAVLAVMAVVLILIILYGGTMTGRLSEGFSQDGDLYKKINDVTNGRLGMTIFSLKTMLTYPLPGVGTGNFTFYLDYKNYGQDYLYDLPLNHYIMIFTENGIFGFFFFTLFLLLLFKASSRKLLVGTILLSLLLNNFFWFPEAFLLFFVITAVDGKQREIVPVAARHKKRFSYIVGVLMLIFIGANIIQFTSLHPQTWARKCGTDYDYGFWYPEKDSYGKSFKWTRDRAGMAITLDENGLSPKYKLSCGAPLPHLEGKKQQVKILWKGKLRHQFTFTENQDKKFQIKAEPHESGFLEIKVLPGFNLKRMGLAAESRDLGIKLFY